MPERAICICDFNSKFVFLEAQKNNSIKVSEKQDLDGQGIFDLARYGSLYLKEAEEVSTATESSKSTEEPLPLTTSVSSSRSQEQLLAEAAALAVSMNLKCYFVLLLTDTMILCCLRGIQLMTV